LKIPNLRWWVAGLLVTASLLNYLDRTALGVAKADITAELQLSGTQYSWVVNSFLIAYTLSYLFGGMLVDRIGTRRSVGLSLSWWSLANMAHALAGSLGTLMGFRFMLGLGEAMFYPAAMRGIAEWFQPRDRSKAVGLLLGGASLGALIAPILVGSMQDMPGVGWRGAFVVTGALGFVLLPFWLYFQRTPREHPLLTEPERRYLEAGAGSAVPEGERRWTIREVLSVRQAWVILAARALTDAAWYLILFWLIGYLQETRGFTSAMVVKYGWIHLATADVGAVFGGWFSSMLIRRGMPLIAARTRSMFVFALLMTASLAGYLVPADMPFVALGLFSLATFGHMAWGANSLTLHSDLFPASRVATIMGITGAAGSLFAVAVNGIVGPLTDHFGNDAPVFIATGCLHPLAAVIIIVGLRGIKAPAEAIKS